MEQQRVLLGSSLVAFEYSKVSLLATPVVLGGKAISFCGNTGTFKKVPELLTLMKELRLTAFPRSIRIDPQQLWALSNSTIPALVCPSDTASRLGLQMMTAKVYMGGPGHKLHEPVGDGRFKETAEPVEGGAVKHKFLPEIIGRAWKLRRLLKTGTCMKK